MNKNEERKIYYFIPYKRNSRGYTRLCGAVGSCSDKSVSEFIQDLVGNHLVDSSFSNVIINVLVNSAHNDKDFMTFAQFLDKFCDNSEVMK